MPNVRFRIDFSAQCSIGPGKIELLEAIGRCGSLRRAAAELGMSYRRAWLLIDSLNQGFAQPCTSAMTGGSGGGGAELTPFGAELVRRYRAAARRIESCVRDGFADFDAQLAPAAARKAAGTGRHRLARRRAGRGRS